MASRRPQARFRCLRHLNLGLISDRGQAAASGLAMSLGAAGAAGGGVRLAAVELTLALQPRSPPRRFSASRDSRVYGAAIVMRLLSPAGLCRQPAAGARARWDVTTN